MANTDMVLEPLRQVTKDLAAWKPELEHHAKLSFERIKLLCRTRGLLKILQVDLPEACKHLDYCLSRGKLYSGYPSDLGSLKVGRVLFPELYLLIFRGTAIGSDIREDPDHNAIFFLRQIYCLYKKVESDPLSNAVKRVVADFVRTDGQLRPPTLPWNSTAEDFAERYQALYRGISMYDLQYMDDLLDKGDVITSRCIFELENCVRILSSMVPVFDYRDVIPRHGPGAVADAKSGEDKYLFPSWSPKVEAYFPREYFAYSSEEVANLCDDESKPVVVPARLHPVPKTIDKPRLITIEPTANQFLQQGLLRWFRDTLPLPLRRCIDFLDQTPSQEAALKASRDGESATVDLSSASDRLSCWTVERVFRQYGGILPYLFASRSAYVVDGTESGEFNLLRLKKFAGQGSAVTFPVQSIVYAIACIAAVAAAEKKVLTDGQDILCIAKRIRVFGDDLVLPKFAVPHLSVILNFLQFKINVGKTHVDGHFRESCGLDAYAGSDVTPVYLSAVALGDSCSDLCSWVDVSNNAYRKGLWHLASYLVGEIPDEKIRRIIVSHVAQSCITLQTFQRGTDDMCGEFRFHPDLHVIQFKGLVPKSRLVTRQREDHRNLLQYFLERDRQENILDAFKEFSFKAGYSVVLRPKLRARWVTLRK